MDAKLSEFMRVFLTLCFLLISTAVSGQENRIALVIGNSNYTDLSVLKNPVNDAEAIANQLAYLGFTVYLATDLTTKNFQSTIQKFQIQNK